MIDKKKAYYIVSDIHSFHSNMTEILYSFRVATFLTGGTKAPNVLILPYLSPKNDEY